MSALAAAVCSFRAAVLVLALSGAAQAQEPNTLAQAQAEGHQTNADSPLGSPYHAGSLAQGDAEVPLRDYLSSRLDQLRSELVARIEALEKQQRDVMDERDRQYAQRFDAQQEALSAALLAQKEAVANALSAAKEAVTKAEDASNKRFDSVNEFRAQLADQANTFVSKDTFIARIAALEDKVSSNSSRLDNIKAQGEGQSNLWGWIIGALGAGLAIFAFFKSREHGRAV